MLINVVEGKNIPKSFKGRWEYVVFQTWWSRGIGRWNSQIPLRSWMFRSIHKCYHILMVKGQWRNMSSIDSVCCWYLGQELESTICLWWRLSLVLRHLRNRSYTNTLTLLGIYPRLPDKVCILIMNPSCMKRPYRHAWWRRERLCWGNFCLAYAQTESHATKTRETTISRKTLAVRWFLWLDITLFNMSKIPRFLVQWNGWK